MFITRKIFDFENKIWLFQKKHQVFITIFIAANWVKPEQPAELTFLTPTLLLGALRATLAEPANE